jgi:acyl-CoA thioesterase YciA
MQTTPEQKPRGEILLRTLAMPADTNGNGDIFGGWIMSQLDLAGAIVAQEITGSRVVTVSVSNITFKAPVSVGDIVCCYGECTRIGNTSLSIALEVWIKNRAKVGMNQHYLACDALFNYVAIDDNGKPHHIST